MGGVSGSGRFSARLNFERAQTSLFPDLHHIHTPPIRSQGSRCIGHGVGTTQEQDIVLESAPTQWNYVQGGELYALKKRKKKEKHTEGRLLDVSGLLSARIGLPRRRWTFLAAIEHCLRQRRGVSKKHEGSMSGI